MIIQNIPESDDWKDSFSFYDAQSIGRGSSGTVFAVNKDLVIKTFSEDEEGQLDFDRERSIYEDLQKYRSSPFVIKFLEVWEDGLVLERLKCSLRSRLREKSQLSLRVRLMWLIQACKALEFIHDRGVMHGDVGCHNFLVDKRGNVKLCDFAGSKREGEIARICYETRGQHPQYRVGQPTTKTEIFALGSTIFEIYTSKAPYADQAYAIIRRLFQEREFPLAEIECPAIRRIVEKCWSDEYIEISDILLDLQAAWEAQPPSEYNTSRMLR